MSESRGTDTDNAAETQADWRTDAAWPDVDVVMPVRNEAQHLATALDAIRAQGYPGRLRIIMAIGPSSDGTERLADAMAEATTPDAQPELTVLRNPSGKTPAALNLAICAGRAPVVVRVDGRSQLCDGYIARAVQTLRRTGAANVGGLQNPVATTPFEASVAAATTSLLGTGGASYRMGGREAFVDTVYLGVFDRAAIESVGLFDERLIRNQDYELNIRLRASGRQVVFDPELSVAYTPRGSWRTLARQYYEYGWWKSQVVRLHPDSLRLRQIVPPVGVAVVIASLLLAVWRLRCGLPALAYAAVVAFTAARSGRASVVRTAGVLVTVQFSWAFGLARGALRPRIGEH